MEFLIDAGDAGACFSVHAIFISLLVRLVASTSAALTGWGGSGREGKGYPQSRLSAPVAIVIFAENGKEPGSPVSYPIAAAA